MTTREELNRIEATRQTIAKAARARFYALVHSFSGRDLCAAEVAGLVSAQEDMVHCIMVCAKEVR